MCLPNSSWRWYFANTLVWWARDGALVVNYYVFTGNNSDQSSPVWNTQSHKPEKKCERNVVRFICPAAGKPNRDEGKREGDNSGALHE